MLTPSLIEHQKQIIEFALKQRLPSIYASKEHAAAAAYATNPHQRNRPAFEPSQQRQAKLPPVLRAFVQMAARANVGWRNTLMCRKGSLPPTPLHLLMSVPDPARSAIRAKTKRTRISRS
jgi:hypothetical protein